MSSCSAGLPDRASVVYVAWDAFTNNLEMAVMKWGWILVTLSMGR